MIARGDLAVECGYERLAELQEEILWLCEAAHLPVIWATQVLEQLAKTAESRHAPRSATRRMSERAECVMLNKGPYINDAVVVTRQHPAADGAPPLQEERAIAKPAFLAARVCTVIPRMSTSR